MVVADLLGTEGLGMEMVQGGGITYNFTCGSLAPLPILRSRLKFELHGRTTRGQRRATRSNRRARGRRQDGILRQREGFRAVRGLRRMQAS